MEEKVTLEELCERITLLEEKFVKLKEWSDLNDYWLREMIDANTECLNKLMGITEEECGGPYGYCEDK